MDAHVIDRPETRIEGALRPCGLVVGSGAGIAPDHEHGIAVVELPVQVGELRLPSNPSDAEMSDFYDLLRRGEQPTTSTPSPGAYLDAFRACASEHIVCLTIPARWSGMDQTARMAAQMLADEEGGERVTVIDTGTAAAGLGLVARLAGRLCAQRKPAEEVVARARRACDEVKMFGALETLVHVARSGRVNGLIAGLSDTLHIRPVFRLAGADTGRVALARTHSGVMSALVKTAEEMLAAVAPRRIEVLVFQADAPSYGDELCGALSQLDRVARAEVIALAPLIGAYAGPGAVGYAAVPLDDSDPDPASVEG